MELFMPGDISFKRDDLKFLTDGTGSIDVDLQKLPLDKPFEPSSPNIFSANFTAQNVGKDFTFGGGAETLSLRINGGASASLKPYFKADRVLSDHGLGDFFNKPGNQLILVLDLAANAQATAAGSFKFGTLLSVNPTITAGVDGEYFYARAYDISKAVKPILVDFFGNLRSPSDTTTPLLPGEVLYFERGGFLSFGADVSIGYQMQGTHDFS